MSPRNSRHEPGPDAGAGSSNHGTFGRPNVAWLPEDDLYREGRRPMVKCMQGVRTLLVLLLSAWGWATTAAAAPETSPSAGELRVAPGFRVELVAAEPLVFDPVAMAFDGDGRLFVAEHRDFPGMDAAPPRLGRIRLLTDTDGDGRMDVSHDFAENLAAPSAVFCWSNGVLVAAANQILLCQDTNRDGRADVQEVLYTGPDVSPQRAFGGMAIRGWAWGWDHRLHAGARGLGLQLLPPPAEDPLSAGLNDHDLVFDPRTGMAAVESTHGSVAVAFDAAGRKLIARPDLPVAEVMWRAFHVDLAGPWVPPPAALELTGPLSAWPLSSGRDHATNRVQPTPSRTLRWFSQITSLTVYRAPLFPPQYSNDVFVADARAGVVRRFKLADAAPERTVLRAPDPAGEFLSSTHPWFRPVQLTVGPEGALYVVDLHREFVDLPEALPPDQQEPARLRRGADRGRIYRIVPVKFQQPSPPRLEHAPLLEVLRTLAHPNPWHRETALRLICQRQDPAAVPLLSNMVATARSPLARQHALDALGGLNALHPAILSRALQDTNAAVRLQAVRWMGTLAETGARIPDGLWVVLRRLSADPSPLVRYELALTLNRYQAPQREIALLEVLRRQPDSPYTRAAVLVGLSRDPGDSLALAMLDPTLTRSPGGRLFLRELARLTGLLEHGPGIQNILTAVQRLPDAELGLSLMTGLQEGLRMRGDTVARFAEWEPFETAWQKTLLAVEDRSLPLPTRVEAARLLSALPYLTTRDVLLPRLMASEPPELQQAALLTLGSYAGTDAVATLVERWPNLAPAARATALRVLMARPETALALLGAIDQGRLPHHILGPWEVEGLRRYPAAQVAEAAQKLLGPPGSTNRTEQVSGWLTNLPPAGVAERGRALFQQRCARCHRFQGMGSAFGPDLEASLPRGRQALLVRILDPNRSISPRAELRWIETREQGFLLGTVLDENPAGLWVLTSDGETLALPRATVRSLSPLGRSAMPEGLESGLTASQMADLLEFLVEPRN